MVIKTIKDALDASVIVGQDKLDAVIEHIYASDLMSDVLAFGKPNSILLTGLATQHQVEVRTPIRKRKKSECPG